MNSFNISDEVFESRLKQIRTKRNRLLTQTDWTQVLDNDLSDDEVFEWREYRQLLRDLPGTVTKETINNVDWPEPPVRG